MDETKLSSPTLMKQMRPTTSSSLFSSPRFFNGFCVKSLSETDSGMSPTSILDSKPFSDKDNSTNSSRLSTEPCLDCKFSPRERTLDSKSVGLISIVDAETNNKNNSNSSTPMVLFGSQLKIQIPSVLSPAEDSPKFPSHSCIKTRNSRPGSSSYSPGMSPNSTKKSPFGSLNSSVGTVGSPRVFTGCLSASEMELSEDYTCVISHGPNPRTTHIFEDCIVDDCFGFNGVSSFKKDNCFSADHLSFSSESFLSFCYNCKMSLVQGKDIYMYRGEKAFCSRECRQQEIQFEEEMEKSEMNY
ncbi:hypothetical protein Scep_009610 [Stephania cephalantha]|uniref:FLZ-type domain-containing protein n=1 Tax=Stephania cephalantha TaxID=152367 RepID=A0AAP0PEH7_9MAGN